MATKKAWPNHTPLRGGGCRSLNACECSEVAGPHCRNCGRLILTETTRTGSHTLHIGMRERLAALERERSSL